MGIFYLLLNEGIDVKQFEANINRVQQEEYPDQEGTKFTLHLQPIQDIHLHSHLSREIVENGDYKSVLIFSAVAILLLIIAAVNFANLNTVQSLGRSKEAGLRKVLGATASNLSVYFLFEALVLTIVSLAVGVVLYIVAFPLLESFIGNELNFDKVLLAQLLVIVVVVITLLSGLYPAQFLARFHPIQALKGGTNSKVRGGTARKILMGLQFVISMALISSTLIVNQQFKFIQNHNLGYNQEQVMVISENPFEVIQSYQTLKKELKKISGVQDVSALMELPTVAIKDMGLLTVKDDPERVISSDIQTFDVNTIDFLEVELLAGESFQESAIKNLPPVKLDDQDEVRDFLVDRPQSYIINESALLELGWENPQEAIGKYVNWRIGDIVYEYGPIIGVIKDFHQENLKAKIDPLVIINEPHWFRHVLVKTSGENHFDVREAIGGQWDQVFEDIPMNVTYLDHEFEKMYVAENKQLQLMSGFTMIALFIAFLGFFGMLAFELKTRAKEIAIRKVLGSSLQEIGFLFGKEYLILTLVSTLLAVPIVWQLMNNWLDGYAYRVQVGGWSFMFSSLILVLILLMVVSFHVLTKASQNPVEYLRDE